MKTKKLIVGILMFIAMTIAFAFLNTTQAASLGKITVSKNRMVGSVTYKHKIDDKNVWKLTKYNPGGSTDKILDLYCIRAGLGFTSNKPGAFIADYVEYTQSFTMSRTDISKSYEDLVGQFAGVTIKDDENSDDFIFLQKNSDKFYQVLWILDHMLLESATDEELQVYLLNEDRAGYTQEELDKQYNDNTDRIRNVLTRADIEAVQQLAIWYFTNSKNSAYNSEELPFINLAVAGENIWDDFNTEVDSKGNDIYETFGDLYNVESIKGLVVRRYLWR